MVGWLYCRKCLIIDWLITAIACTTHKYTFIRYMRVAVDQVILLAILEIKKITLALLDFLHSDSLKKRKCHHIHWLLKKPIYSSSVDVLEVF